jgi:hypothetical protein
LEREGLVAPESSDTESLPPFEDDPLDANLVPAVRDSWPLPDLEAVLRHWAAAKSNYAAGVRHLRGQPVSLARLIAAIENGPMLRRPDFIFEAAIRTAGQYDVEARAFTHVQRRMMAAGSNALAQRGIR